MTTNNTTTTTTTEGDNAMLDTTQIVARLCSGEGATIDATTGEDITTGYAVATNIQLRVPEWVLSEFVPTVESFIATARDRYPVLGSWAARGFREYAVTSVFEDREVALCMARLMGEEAIFDLANCEEIAVN